MQMKKHLFGENNSLNEFQYLTELVIGFQPRHNLVKKKRSLLLDDSWSFIASSLNPILFAWELDLFSPYMSDSIRNQASINEMKWNKKKKQFLKMISQGGQLSLLQVCYPEEHMSRKHQPYSLFL